MHAIILTYVVDYCAADIGIGIGIGIAIDIICRFVSMINI